MKKFTSINELMEDMKKNRSLWDKFILHPLMEWLRWIIYNLPDVPRDFYRKCKRGYQRAYRGWSDEDLWGFDDYLTNIILNGLKQFKNHHCSFPPNITMEEWNRILDSMIWTFEVNKKFREDSWLLMPLDGWSKEEQERLKSFHLMTKEETQKYYVGWHLFQRYYFDLWD